MWLPLSGKCIYVPLYCPSVRVSHFLTHVQQISALKAQRDIKSRDLAKMVSSRKTTVEQSKVWTTFGIRTHASLSLSHTKMVAFSLCCQVFTQPIN